MVKEEQNFAYDFGQVNEELSRFTIFKVAAASAVSRFAFRFS